MPDAAPAVSHATPPEPASTPRVRRLGNAWLILASQVLVTLGPAATRDPGFTVHMDGEGFIFAVPAESPPPANVGRVLARLGAQTSVLDLARALAQGARQRALVRLVDED